MHENGADQISFDELNNDLAAMGLEQFDYNSFVAEYKSDPKLKGIIKNFNDQGIMFKQGNASDLGAPAMGKSKVPAMAKRATNVGAEL